jgi:hypothetical protein
LTARAAKRKNATRESPVACRGGRSEQNKLGMIQINNMLPVTEAKLTLLDMDAQPEK